MYMWSIIPKHVFRDKEVMVVRPRDRKCRRSMNDDVTQLDRGHTSTIQELMLGDRILDSWCSQRYSLENNRRISHLPSRLHFHFSARPTWCHTCARLDILLPFQPLTGEAPYHAESEQPTISPWRSMTTTPVLRCG
jgi:hypothetical protein